jgi:hypothetical protein
MAGEVAKKRGSKLSRHEFYATLSVRLLDTKQQPHCSIIEHAKNMPFE